MDKKIKIYPPVMNAGRWIGGVSGVVLAALTGFAWWHGRSTLERYYLWPYVSVTLHEQTPKFGKQAEPPEGYVVLANQGPTQGRKKGEPGPCLGSSVLVTELDLRDRPNQLSSPCAAQLPPGAFKQLLASQIYHGQAVETMLTTPGIWAGSFLFLGFLGGATYDRKRRRRMVLNGQQTRGPVLMTQAQYNRKMVFGKDGLRIVTVAGNKQVDF